MTNYMGVFTPCQKNLEFTPNRNHDRFVYDVDNVLRYFYLFRMYACLAIGNYDSLD